MSGSGRHTERPSLLPADGPLRRAHRSPAEMTRRAWQLVGLHLAIPGIAQVRLVPPTVPNVLAPDYTAIHRLIAASAR